MDPATLRTGRLLLVPLSTRDLDEATVLYTDETVIRHIGGDTPDRSTITNLLQANERCWQTEGWGLWAVRAQSSGGFLGECGLKRCTELPEVTVDFGCALSRRSRGQGYATEAGNAVIEDAWTRFPGNQIHALIDGDNMSCRILLRKLGFRRLDDRIVGGLGRQVWQTQRFE